MKKRKKIEIDPELRARGLELRRLLAERIAYHEQRRERLRRERGEGQT